LGAAEQAPKERKQKMTDAERAEEHGVTVRPKLGNGFEATGTFVGPKGPMTLNKDGATEEKAIRNLFDTARMHRMIT